MLLAFRNNCYIPQVFEYLVVSQESPLYMIICVLRYGIYDMQLDGKRLLKDKFSNEFRLIDKEKIRRFNNYLRRKGQ